MKEIGVIRYPGSKGRIAGKLIEYFPDGGTLPIFMAKYGRSYCEPFFGAGAVGFFVMNAMQPGGKVILCDKDVGIVNLWKSVMNDPEALCCEVEAFTPSVEAFYRMKEEDGASGKDILISGFEKLALHRMSWGGIGAVAGGPIGGKEQKNETHNISCRWNPARICYEIQRATKILNKHNTSIVCQDFERVLDGCTQGTIVYADPPYYKAGPGLYKHFFNDDDHVRLRDALHRSPCPWVLSYDDHERIRSLYSGDRIEEIALTSFYPKSACERKNNEIVITPIQ